jgi:hypothetical protein
MLAKIIELEMKNEKLIEKIDYQNEQIELFRSNYKDNLKLEIQL